MLKLRYRPIIMRLVPDFGGWFCPIFGQEKYEFLAMTVRTFSDENSSNQFYIRLYVQIFNNLFCLLRELLFNYILINTFKTFLPHTLSYIHTKLPMMAIRNSETADDSRSIFWKTTIYHLWQNRIN